MTLDAFPLAPDRRRADGVRRARRRRLRRGLLVAAGRAEPTDAEVGARPRAPRDRAGVGGEPRLADLRAGRLLDGLPDRVRLDRVDARRSRSSSPRSGSSCAARRTPCASGPGSAGELHAVDLVFALSSIIVPFAFGAAIGGIASGRVPVGNAEGDTFSSWLNWTSFLVGVLAVAVAAYLAAVYLAADATRLGSPELAEAFRVRALVMGVAAGAIAMAGLVVVRHDARADLGRAHRRLGPRRRARLGRRGRRDDAARLDAPLRPGARDGRGRGRRSARRLGAGAAARRAARPLDPPGRRRPLDAGRARDRDRDRRGAADPVARDPLRPAARRPLRRRGPRTSARRRRPAPPPSHSRLAAGRARAARRRRGADGLLRRAGDADARPRSCLFAFAVCGFLVLAAPVEADR